MLRGIFVWPQFSRHIRTLAMNPSKEAVRKAAEDFLAFVNKSPSPFHATEQCCRRLLAAGFKEIKEIDSWNVKPNDKCFLTRNHSAVIAFAVGGRFKPGNGFSIIGAHTDSPCLKVKPVSRRVKQGYIQVGVELYGGGMWHTWFDRDLKISGRVIIKDGDKICHRLVDINRPVLRVPNLAIHLQREMATKFEFNKETHMTPVLATAVQEQLEMGNISGQDVDHNKDQSEKHHPVLIKLLCAEMNVQPSQIMDFELCLSDHNPAVLTCQTNLTRCIEFHSKYMLEGVIDLLGNPNSDCEGFENEHESDEIVPKSEVDSESDPSDGAASVDMTGVLKMTLFLQHTKTVS